jgi:hypothetical protein
MITNYPIPLSCFCILTPSASLLVSLPLQYHLLPLDYTYERKYTILVFQSLAYFHKNEDLEIIWWIQTFLIQRHQWLNTETENQNLLREFDQQREKTRLTGNKHLTFLCTCTWTDPGLGVFCLPPAGDDRHCSEFWVWAHTAFPSLCILHNNTWPYPRLSCCSFAGK